MVTRTCSFPKSHFKGPSNTPKSNNNNNNDDDDDDNNNNNNNNNDNNDNNNNNNNNNNKNTVPAWPPVSEVVVGRCYGWPPLHVAVKKSGNSWSSRSTASQQWWSSVDAGDVVGSVCFGDSKRAFGRMAGFEGGAVFGPQVAKCWNQAL